MKQDSALTRMTPFQEKLHEEDKKQFPERHSLTKDYYDHEDTLNMCIRCSDHYEWGKQLEYDARTDRFYKKRERNE